MENQLHDLSGAVGRIEQHLLNKPPINAAAWTGVFLTFVAMMFGGVFGINTWVGLMLDPIESQVSIAREERATQQEFRHQAHYEFGLLHHSEKALDRETEELRDWLTRVDAQVNRNREQIAEAVVSRRAIGDYTRELSERHEHLANTVREFQAQAQFIHGQREELGKRVEAIDSQGSRVWFRDQKEKPADP